MNNIDIYELDPNFAVVYSFLSTFGEQIGDIYKDITIKEFKTFLDADKVDISHVLVGLHRSFLRAIGTGSYKAEVWEKGVIKFCEDFPNGDGELIQEKGYANVPVKVKLRVLKNLCEDQFEFNDKFNKRINDALKNGELENTLHNDPIGRDRLGRSYWFLMDNEGCMRLFRGWRNELTGEEKWNLICRDCDELGELIDILQSDKQLTQDDPSLPAQKEKYASQCLETLDDLLSNTVFEDVAQALFTSGNYYRVPNPWSPTKVIKEEEKHEIPHSFVKISRLKNISESNKSCDSDSDDSVSDNQESETVAQGVLDIDSNQYSKKKLMGPKSKRKRFLHSDKLSNVIADMDKEKLGENNIKIEKESTFEKECDLVNSDSANSEKAVGLDNKKCEKLPALSDISDAEEAMPTLRNERSDDDKSDLDIFESIPVLINESKVVGGKVSENDERDVEKMYLNGKSGSEDNELKTGSPKDTVNDRNASLSPRIDVDKLNTAKHISQDNEVNENSTDSIKSKTCFVELEKLTPDSLKSLDKESIGKSPNKATANVSPIKSPKTKPCVVELENISPLKEKSKRSSTSPKKVDVDHSNKDLKCEHSDEVTKTVYGKDKMKTCVVELEKLRSDKAHKNGTLPVSNQNKSQNSKVADFKTCDCQDSESCQSKYPKCSCSKLYPKNQIEKSNVKGSDGQHIELSSKADRDTNKLSEDISSEPVTINEKGDNQSMKEVMTKLNSSENGNYFSQSEESSQDSVKTATNKSDTRQCKNDPFSDTNKKSTYANELSNNNNYVEEMDTESDDGECADVDIETCSENDSEMVEKEAPKCNVASVQTSENHDAKPLPGNMVRAAMEMTSDTVKSGGIAGKSDNSAPVDIDQQNIDNALKDLITLEEIIKHGKTVGGDSGENSVSESQAGTSSELKSEQEDDEKVFTDYLNSLSYNSYESPVYKRLVTEYKPKQNVKSSLFEQEQTCKKETLDKVKSIIGKSLNQTKKGPTGPKKGTPLKKPRESLSLKTSSDMKVEKEEGKMEVDGDSLKMNMKNVSVTAASNDKLTVSTVSVSAANLSVNVTSSSMTTISTVSLQKPISSTSQVTTSTPSVVNTPYPALGSILSIAPPSQPPKQDKNTTNTVTSKVIPVLLQNPLVINPSVGDNTKTSQQSLFSSPNLILQTPGQLAPSGLLQLPFQPLLMNSGATGMSSNMTSLLTSNKGNTVKSLLHDSPSLKFPRSLLASNTTLSNLQPTPPVSKSTFLNAHKKSTADNKMTIKVPEKTVSKEYTIVKGEDGHLYHKNTGQPFVVPPDCVVALLQPDGKYYEAISGKVVDLKMDLSKFKQKPSVMCIKKLPPAGSKKLNQVNTNIKTMDKAKTQNVNKKDAELKEKIRTNMETLKSQLKLKPPKADKVKGPLPQQSMSTLANMLKKSEPVKYGSQNTLQKPKKHRKKIGRPKLSDDEDSDDVKSDSLEELDDKSSESEVEEDPDYDYDKISARIKLAQAGWLPKKEKVEDIKKLEESEDEQEMEIYTGSKKGPALGRNARLLAPSQGLYSLKLEAMDIEVNKTPCVTCQKIGDPCNLLICDECEDCYHMLCLPTLLTVVPLGDWLCPECEHNLLVEELKKRRKKVRRILGKKYRSVPVTNNKESNLNTQDMFELSQANIIQRKSGRSSKVVNYSEDKYDKLVKQAVKDAEKDSSATEVESGQDTDTRSESEPQSMQKQKEKKKSTHRSAKSQGSKKGGKPNNRKPVSEPVKSKRQKLDSDLSDESDFNCSDSASSEDYDEPTKEVRVKSTEPVEEIYYTSSGRKTNSMSRVSKYL